MVIFVKIFNTMTVRRFYNSVNKCSNRGGVIIDLSQTHEVLSGAYIPIQPRIFKISLKNIELREYETSQYDSIVAMESSISKSEIRILGDNRKTKILIDEWVNIEEGLHEDISIYFEYYKYQNSSKVCNAYVFVDGNMINTHKCSFFIFSFMDPLCDIYINKGHSLNDIENIIVSEVDAVGD